MVQVAAHPLGPWTDLELDINPPVEEGDLLGLGPRVVPAQVSVV